MFQPSERVAVSCVHAVLLPGLLPACGLGTGCFWGLERAVPASWYSQCCPTPTLGRSRCPQREGWAGGTRTSTTQCSLRHGRSSRASGPSPADRLGALTPPPLSCRRPESSGPGVCRCPTHPGPRPWQGPILPRARAVQRLPGAGTSPCSWAGGAGGGVGAGLQVALHADGAQDWSSSMGRGAFTLDPGPLLHRGPTGSVPAPPQLPQQS